jgi:hypothetical protein
MRIAAGLVAAIVAVLMPARSDALLEERGSGIQVTPEGEQVLVNKDVDAQRWTITRNVDDLSVTGNASLGRVARSRSADLDAERRGG